MGIFTACPNSHVPVVAPTTPTTFEVGTAGLLQSFGGSSGLKQRRRGLFWSLPAFQKPGSLRSEEHTSELQSLMRISYAVFCLKQKNNQNNLHIYLYT